MQNYQRHTPSEDEPWWTEVSSPADPRYQRAVRLSQFAQAIARGPMATMKPRRLAYRQQCIDRWRDYLDGWTPAGEP